jgi:hypothetical protein
VVTKQEFLRSENVCGLIRMVLADLKAVGRPEC